MRRFLSLLLIISSGMFTCLHAQYSGQGKVFKNKVNKFSLRAPAQWEINTDRQAPVIVSFKSPVENFNNDYREEIRVEVTTTGAVSLDDFRQTRMNELGAAMDSIRILESGTATVSNHKTAWVLFNFYNWDKDLQVLSYFILNRDRGFTVQCMALPSTYKKYKPVFRQTIETLRIK